VEPDHFISLIQSESSIVLLPGIVMEKPRYEICFNLSVVSALGSINMGGSTAALHLIFSISMCFVSNNSSGIGMCDSRINTQYSVSYSAFCTDLYTLEPNCKVSMYLLNIHGPQFQTNSLNISTIRFVDIV
jgi:hypothetical protein